MEEAWADEDQVVVRRPCILGPVRGVPQLSEISWLSVRKIQKTCSAEWMEGRVGGVKAGATFIDDPRTPGGGALRAGQLAIFVLGLERGLQTSDKEK